MAICEEVLKGDFTNRLWVLKGSYTVVLKTNVAQTCTHTQKEKLRHGEFQERIVYEEVCVCVSAFLCICTWIYIWYIWMWVVTTNRRIVHVDVHEDQNHSKNILQRHGSKEDLICVQLYTHTHIQYVFNCIPRRTFYVHSLIPRFVPTLSLHLSISLPPPFM